MPSLAFVLGSGVGRSCSNKLSLRFGRVENLGSFDAAACGVDHGSDRVLGSRERNTGGKQDDAVVATATKAISS